MIHEIYIIDDEMILTESLKFLFKAERDFKLVRVKTDNVKTALNKIPAMMIINEDNVSMDTIELCDLIRTNEDNSITPIIVVSSIQDKPHRLEILRHSVEYYIRKPIDNDYLFYTVKNLMFPPRRTDRSDQAPRRGASYPRCTFPRPP